LVWSMFHSSRRTISLGNIACFSRGLWSKTYFGYFTIIRLQNGIY